MTNPNTHLYNLAIAFAEEHPTPIAFNYQSWDGLCGVAVNRFIREKLGGFVSPVKVATPASAIGDASGWLNPNFTTAPVGAIHFWTNHVGIDMNGGGQVVFMATKAKLIWSIGIYLGVQSVEGYVFPGQKYRGWAMNYGGGIFNYTEPSTTPAEVNTPTPVVVPPVEVTPVVTAPLNGTPTTTTTTTNNPPTTIIVTPVTDPPKNGDTPPVVKAPVIVIDKTQADAIGNELADVTSAALTVAGRKKVYKIMQRVSAIAAPVYALGVTSALFVGGQLGLDIAAGVGVVGIAKTIVDSFTNKLAKDNTNV